MNKEELKEKRSQTIESLNDIKAILGLDELYIDELEKENAELKLKLDALDGQTPWKDIKDKSEVIGKLSKAKDVIKKLHSHVFQGMGFMEINDYDVEKAEVEQFLKDSEVEK